MNRLRFARRARVIAILPLLLDLGAFAADAEIAEDGARRFLDDCAACHGDRADGHGPMAGLFTPPPSDLRVLATRDGSFPEDYVRRVIDGRDLPLAHGTTAMPVWGREYNRSAAGQGERLVERRIDVLVAYLKSIQGR